MRKAARRRVITRIVPIVACVLCLGLLTSCAWIIRGWDDVIDGGIVRPERPAESVTMAGGDLRETDTSGETTETAGSAVDWDALYPEDGSYVLSTEHLLEVGTGHNVIVILIDRFDTRYVDMIAAADPDYGDLLADFTYYNNNVSTYSRTYPAVATMLTGTLRDFAPQSTAADYFETAYQNSPLLKALKENGYAVNLYTAEYYAYRNARALRGYVDNIAAAEDSGTTPYEICDSDLYAQLATEGLTIGDATDTFTFLHLNGTHYPYQIDENGADPGKNGTAEGAARGSMAFVRMYVEELKRLGVYDNATVIVTGDHPDPISDYCEPTRARPTALFVKQAGVQHPFETSSAPLSDLDLIPSVLQEIRADPADINGTAYWDVDEHAERTRYHYFLLNSKPSGNESVTVYAVTGDARVFENWERVENKSINGRIYR